MALDHINTEAIIAARHRLNELAEDATERTHGYALRISHALDAVFIIATGSVQWAPISEVLLAELRAPWALVGIEYSWVCGEGLVWRDIKDQA